MRIVRATFRASSVATACVFALAIAAGGCSSESEDFASKFQTESTQKCNEGNQAACHTVVQALGDTKVAIDSTAPIEFLTPACNAGKQDACEQMAVLHSELSSWCAMGNNQACTAVKVGPWPAKWDEPALIDAAKLSCMSGKLKADSSTCQALRMM
jgi:hypothetical protein